MTEADVEIIIQRALEKHPKAKPRIISDNGRQYPKFCVWIGFTWFYFLESAS
jgi:hypothetical protein